jgi:hypothetical protein
MTSTTEITISALTLRAMLRALLPAVPATGKAASRPELAQIHLRVSPTYLVGQGTDGYRLHRLETPWRAGVAMESDDGQTGPRGSWGWTQASSAALVKALGGRLDPALTATISPQRVALSDGRLIPMVAAEGAFPDTVHVIPAFDAVRPASAVEVSRFNVKYMTEALEAAHAIGADELDVQPGLTGFDPALLRAVGGLDGPCPEAVLMAVLMPMRR